MVMVGGRRARGRRARRRRRHGLRRGRGRLGVADEDLRSGRQAAVRGGEVHVEADDEAAMTAALARVLVSDGLLEGDCIAPVAERDLCVRGRRHALAQDDEVRDPRPGEISAGARRGGARNGLGGHGVGRHLASEERDRADPDESPPDGAVVVDRRIRPARDRAGGHGPVSVRPADEGRGRLRRRRDRARGRRRLARHDDPDAEGARRGRGRGHHRSRGAGGDERDKEESP